MQNLEVLYYPNFQPSEDWFRKYLLLYDSVRTIVPKNIDFEPTFGITEIDDLIPNSFRPTPLKNSEKEIKDVRLKSLRKAFESLRQNPPEMGVNRVSVTINQNGIFDHNGFACIADSKICENIRRLIFECNLVDVDASSGELLVIDHRASDLIMCNLADNVGRNHGWDTITDKIMPFSLLTSNTLDYHAISRPEAMLAASIVQTSVPANITDLTVEQYVELRSDYADIRETFREYIVETVQKEQLKDIGDKEQLESIINKLSNNFNSKICKIKELNKYRIPEWVDIGIGVASLVGNFSDDPIPKAIGTSSVLVQPFLRGQIEKRVVGGHDIHHTFANLQSDIDWQYTVRRLLQAGWF